MSISPMRSAFLITLVLFFASTGLASPPQANDSILGPTMPDKSLLSTDKSANCTGPLEFYTVPPAGWSVMTSGAATTWEVYDAIPGYPMAIVYAGAVGAVQDEWLISSAYDFTGFTNPILDFNEGSLRWLTDGYRHQVLVSTTVPNDPAAFTPVVTSTPANQPDLNNLLSRTVVDLTAFAGEPVVYIAFRYEGNGADDWVFRDFRICQLEDHDVAATGLSPSGVHEVSQTVPLSATVENRGANTETFAAQYEILLDGLAVYSESVTVTDLAPGGAESVTFPDFVSAVEGSYVTRVTALLASDEDLSDNVVGGAFNLALKNHVPLMFMFTNSGCPPCLALNLELDTWTPTQANSVAVVRIHLWWPFPNDPMHLDNEAQTIAFMNDFDVAALPEFWMDGTVTSNSRLNWSVPTLEAAKFKPTPMRITPVLYDFVQEELTVEIDIMEPMTAADYRLICMFTEDDIQHDGGNGETVHHQAFRYAYPNGAEGMAIDTTVGLHTITIPMPIDPLGNGNWRLEKLRTTCYVQARGAVDNLKVIEAGTDFLTNIADMSVSTAISNLYTEVSGSTVSLSWQSNSQTAEFRLLRLDSATGTEVAFESTTAGVYTATDLVAAGTYDYQLLVRFAGGDWSLMQHENVTVTPPVAMISGIGDNFPNPFNPSTDISYSLSASGSIKIAVYDLQGRQVATLFEGVQEAGEHSITWQADRLGSGIYLVRLVGDGFTDTRKVVLAK